MRTRHQKKSYHIFLWIAIPLLLYLCYVEINRSEVGDSNFTEILCIDEKDGKYTVTALYNNAGKKNKDSMELIDGTGNSVYTAYIDMSRKNSKDISLDHTAYFMIGQTAAADGLGNCLDFISREADLKANAEVFIVKSDSTNKLLKNALKKDFAPSETLNAISSKQTNNLKKPMNSLLQVLNDMDHRYNNLLIPYLVYDNDTMFLEGYATFKEKKLYRLLDYDLSQAIDFYRNNLRTCPLELSRNLNVELTNIQVKQQVLVKDNMPTLNVNVTTDSTIKEAIQGLPVFQKKSLAALNELEQLKLSNWLIEIVMMMKHEQLDLLNIGLELSTHVGNDQINAHWGTYLENLDISLNVDSATSKTYLIETD
ncbi:MAG: hypothetical protein IKL07_04790 [Clostridium sp.]|nr:hypothetical protein [Clostridium sp.]